MKKAPMLIFIGVIILISSAGFGTYSNRVYDTSQCIATFKGQDSLVCRAGGSSTATIILQGLFIIGLMLTVIGTTQYIRKQKAR